MFLLYNFMDTPPVKNRATKYGSLLAGIILVGLAFGSGVAVGKNWYVSEATTVTSTGEVSISKVIDLNRSINHSDTVDFNQFWDVWDKIKQKYVKQPVKDSDLFYGALQGLVYGLKDPYSVYFPPAEAKDFSKSLSGDFSGIGAEIAVKKNQLVVVAPLPGTPAEAAGLKPNDKILAIDKRSTAGMDVNTAVEFIRGPATSSVMLTILRDGWKAPQDKTIHRANINVPAVTYEMKPGNIAYIKITQFNDYTVPLFNRYVSQLTSQHARGLILDLRNNPGGYLDGAISIASEWVTSGKIVSEKASDGSENVHYSEGTSHPLNGLKTIVLVNGGSASASEIVAGALKDDKLATIIGEKTFGKGSVQDLETFPDGSALKVTVAEWYTPNEHNINDTGITPDVAVVENVDNEAVGEDVMITKALELLAAK